MESFGFLRNGKENPAGRPLLPGGHFDITGRLFDITDDLNIKQKDRTPAKLQASGHQIKRARDGDRTHDPNLGKVVLYQLSYFRIVASAKVMLFLHSTKRFTFFKTKNPHFFRFIA